MNAPSTQPVRGVHSFALYDFANSAFTTLVVTFVYATYFTKGMAPDEITGTAWWSRAVTISALAIAVLSPILGSLADRHGPAAAPAWRNLHSDGSDQSRLSGSSGNLGKGHAAPATSGALSGMS